MTVDTIDSPLQDIDFPAITLCPSPTFQPDNWDLTEKVFNMFKFNCEAGDDDCKEIGDDLQPFFQKIFELVSEKIDQLEFELTSVVGYNKFSELQGEP